MPTTSGVQEAAPAVSVARRRAVWARPAVGVVPTHSGTSHAILAVPSWDHPRPVALRGDRPCRADRSRAARARTRNPKRHGGVEVVLAAPAARVAQAAMGAAVPRRRPAVVVGHRARRERVNRTVAGGTRATGRHRPRAGRRERAVGAGASPASEIRVVAMPGSGAGSPEGPVTAGPTTWGPTRPAASWVVPPAVGHKRRRAPSRWPEGGRCATPTSGRPTVAAEPAITRRYGADPWVTRSMSRR
jgi:hypothetical protein